MRLIFIDEFVKQAERIIPILFGCTVERGYPMVFGKFLKLFSLLDLAVE
jgi:hypothetical protein